MSRKSTIAAGAVLALVLAAGPAPAFAAELSAPVTPVASAPGGTAQPTAVWTWLCQLFGGCK